MSLKSTNLRKARVCLVQREWRRVRSSYRQRVPAGDPRDHRKHALPETERCNNEAMMTHGGARHCHLGVLKRAKSLNRSARQAMNPLAPSSYCRCVETSRTAWHAAAMNERMKAMTPMRGWHQGLGIDPSGHAPANRGVLLKNKACTGRNR